MDSINHTKYKVIMKEKRKLLLLLLSLCVIKLSAGAQVLFNGKQAAVDNLTGTWLVSVPETAYGADYTVAVSLDDGITQCCIDGLPVDTHYTFRNVGPGISYRLTALKGSDTIQAKVQFTFWPVIQIYGDFVKRPYASGTVVYTHPDSVAQETLISRVRWAGSSTAEPGRQKHNFHLKFYNADGSKKDMSFFGLRSDFHWRLDAGQIDFARVRNRVAKDIWAEFAHQPYYAAYEPKTPYNYVRGDFVEVFLNDEYMGIYSLNEHMDRQQLKLKKYDYNTGTFHGGLWKPMTKTYTSLFRQLPNVNASQKDWDQIFVKYPNLDDVNPTNFSTMYNAVKFTIESSTKRFADSAAYYFDIPVMRDYYMFLLLMQAPDNIGKNLYYACYDVATDKRLTLAIWDWDCTQGQFWSNEPAYYHHTQVSPTYDLQNNNVFNHKMFNLLKLTDPSFHGMATDRYWELHETTFSVDSIVARYRAYFDEMKRCGADQREITRWSGGTDLGGRPLDFDNELDYLRDWWTQHIAYLDEKVFVPYPVGDMNYDRTINVSDAVILIGHLMNSQGDDYIWSYDVNKDGLVNVTDVIELVTKLSVE